jgi:hypothetical protein
LWQTAHPNPERKKMAPVKRKLETRPTPLQKLKRTGIETELPDLIGAFWNSPEEEDGALRLVEVGGISLRRNQY